MEKTEQLGKQAKDQIEGLISKGELAQARKILSQYASQFPNDIDIYSMQAVMLILENRLDEAEIMLNNALQTAPENFDLLYNLAYLYESKGKYLPALQTYRLAQINAEGENAPIIEDAIKRLTEQYPEVLRVRPKLAFFVKQGMDSFLNDIIDALSEEYETRKIVVTQYPQIDAGMHWADVCWFEWCDELVVYGSKLSLAAEKKLVCRIHSYEAFTGIPQQVNWQSVDHAIFVAESIKNLLLENTQLNNSRSSVIPNGVQLGKYTFKPRQDGFNIAYVGYINYKKGPMLLLHTLKAIVERDNRYKLFMAGTFQDQRDVLYYNQMIEEMGLQDNLIFQGWQNDLDTWLEDKNYIICTSVLESQNMSVMQAMSKGIKPLVHNFVGARGIYPVECIWNSIGEAVNMLTDGLYHSEAYRNFVDKNYSFNVQVAKLKELLQDILSKSNDLRIVDYSSCGYLREAFAEFNSYSAEEIDCFDLSEYKLVVGKKEKLSARYLLLEFILRNTEGKQLIFSNVWYDNGSQEIVLPDYVLYSNHCEQLVEIIKQLLELPVEFNNNIAGMIFDQELNKDIENNSLVYTWEHGIPASQFMPAMQYLKIFLRYKFAAQLMKKNDVVLEAAAGFGYGAAYFAKHCKKVEALDIAADNIEFGKKTYYSENINWTVGDVTQLPFADETFDVYASFETFEHLRQEQLPQYLDQARRVLKKGGRMILSTPNKLVRRHIHNPFHVKEYDFNELDAILKTQFSDVVYYSVIDYTPQEGVDNSAHTMIAVCQK